MEARSVDLGEFNVSLDKFLIGLGFNVNDKNHLKLVADATHYNYFVGDVLEEKESVGTVPEYLRYTFMIKMKKYSQKFSEV